MSLISYAQNCEDIMLYRALRDIPNGFYIDVGANHPEEDSVTKLFYDLGWTGINIEPEREYYEALQVKRPKDINLNIAISATQKHIDFFVSKIRGWSTTEISNLAQQEKESLVHEKRTVIANRLDDIIQKYAKGEIHFLKIDVEGAEKDVLESFSLEKIRPWIIVIEAINPLTHEDISGEWEHLILNHRYIYVYCDGVNKFYLAEENIHLQNQFFYPSNVLDDFIVAGYQNTLNALEEREIQIQACFQQIDELTQEIESIKFKMNNGWAHYHTVINSRSWKITKPLRILTRILNTLSSKTKKSNTQEHTPHLESFSTKNLSQAEYEIFTDLKKKVSLKDGFKECEL
ncbi:MAG: FkbM family methyltransferase [Sulfurospirillaceae bacterium]|nr:FkbM family methyltransferase [Sulfurospirillaceae bacterium]